MVIGKSATSQKNSAQGQLKMPYFFTPTTEYTPGDAIRLGSILSDPASPDKTLNSNQNLQHPTTPFIATYSTSDWRAALSTPNSLYVQYLEAVVGSGVRASIRANPRNRHEYEFRVLETTYLNPFELHRYLEYCLELDGSWTNDGHFYIITELKVIRGSKLTSTSNNVNEGGDFVFAYRVGEFRLRKSMTSACGVEVDIIGADDKIANKYNQEEIMDAIDDDGDITEVIMPMVYVM